VEGRKEGEREKKGISIRRRERIIRERDFQESKD
jgi:hypothetical protein